MHMNDTHKVDIRALAALSKIEIAESDIPKLEAEVSEILSFVETISGIEVGDEWRGDKQLRNVLREDENPHENGKYTEALLNAAPARSGDYIEVQQVLGHVKK